MFPFINQKFSGQLSQNRLTIYIVIEIPEMFG